MTASRSAPPSDATDIDRAKLDPRRRHWVKYKLSRAVVYESPGGYLFTDYLDDDLTLNPEVDERALTDALVRYIEDDLSSDEARLQRHLEWLARHTRLAGARVLDVGCGGGLLLARLRERGAEVEGTELSDPHVVYARRKHGLTVHKRALDDPSFQSEHAAHYDAITLFDVLEHVNFPLRTLRAAAALLCPGGVLLIETPCRDALLHRVGELGYRLSRGRHPTLLDLMYSNHPFGHKQIFSQRELGTLLAAAGLHTVELGRVHELSRPYASYLHKLVPSHRAAEALVPLARAFFTLVPVPNKLVAAARKA